MCNIFYDTNIWSRHPVMLNLVPDIGLAKFNIFLYRFKRELLGRQNQNFVKFKLAWYFLPTLSMYGCKEDFC